MQLPASDELVLVSGLPPIQAKKLRYFEEGRFRCRVTDAPALGQGPYADRPACRSDAWSGLCAEAPPPAAADDGFGGGEGLQQERHPSLPDEQSVSAVVELTERPGPDEEDDDSASSARLVARLQQPSPVIAAHVANEGAGPDLLPSF